MTCEGKVVAFAHDIPTKVFEPPYPAKTRIHWENGATEVCMDMRRCSYLLDLPQMTDTNWETRFTHDTQTGAKRTEISLNKSERGSEISTDKNINHSRT